MCMASPFAQNPVAGCPAAIPAFQHPRLAGSWDVHKPPCFPSHRSSRAHLPIRSPVPSVPIPAVLNSICKDFGNWGNLEYLFVQNPNKTKFQTFVVFHDSEHYFLPRLNTYTKEATQICLNLAKLRDSSVLCFTYPRMWLEGPPLPNLQGNIPQMHYRRPRFLCFVLSE